ncbi:MAG: Hsp20/alpha crystallin family protein [candidate division WOR-3 bacterium]
MLRELDDIIQLFDEAEALVASFWEFQFPSSGMTWSPATDVFLAGDVVHVRVEVPGVARKDLKIAVSPVLIEVSGFRPTPASFRNGTSFYELEIPYGVFRKRIALPCRVNPQEVTGELEAGLLTLVLPKAGARPDSTRRVIRVRKGGNSR